MNRISLFLTVILITSISLVGCKKDENPEQKLPPLDNEALVSELFTAAMNWSIQPAKGSWPVNVQVDATQNGPKGGYIHVTGSVTGNILFNDQTYEVTGGTLLIGITEVINNYVVPGEDGKDYTINGAPHLSVTGTFTLLSINTFGTASNLTISGGLRVTGNGYDTTVNINLTININSTGTGGHVSGYIGSEQVDFYF